MAKAPPDGYTLLLSADSFYLGPLLRDDAPYDPVRDFSPITLVVNSPSILVVHASVPANSVKELIVLAKAKQGELNYSTAAAGSSSHTAAELFKSMAGINMVHVPYKGTAAANTALISGEVQLTFSTFPPVAPHLKAGRLRALAVTSLQPSALSPQLPTVAASGLPGYESGTITGVLVPAKTPKAVIYRLNAEIVRILNTTEIRERFLNAGSEIVAGTPRQFADTIKQDMTTMGKVIKDAGIREQ